VALVAHTVSVAFELGRARACASGSFVVPAKFPVDFLVDFGREISRGGTCRRGIAKRRIRRALVRSVITRPLRETHARFSGDGAAHR